MSSESGGESHRSETPRKRRRLYSTNSSTRKHESHRRPDLEAKYNDEYRLLYNEYVATAASRFVTDTSLQHYANQVGSSVWSSHEQDVFFAALERLGKDDLPGIATAVATKTEPETREFLLLLQDAAAKQHSTHVTFRDIPAAIELGDECGRQLEEAGDALAWYQEKLEAVQEQQRYGSYWLITSRIAEDIEDAVAGVDPPRDASAPLISESEGSSRGIVGACESCKKRKLKCDRRVPCTKCTRYQVDCLYEKNPPKSVEQHSLHTIGGGEHHASSERMSQRPLAQILEALPEGHLLRPEAMLKLSRDLFMNRSSDFPSPWPHWSAYTSELATEPSIYRTAFRDLHRLTISITRRLVKTAIMQATSRLRAQRQRGIEKDSKKWYRPLLKRRDVRAAIDVLGMKSNGRDLWVGVSRRCNLRVTVKEKTSKSKREKVLPWEEVERLLGSPVLSDERSPFEDGLAAEPEQFKSRAARSGTPRPLHDFDSSDSEGGITTGSIGDSDTTSDYGKPKQQRRTSKSQPRDVAGKYTSLPPAIDNDEHGYHLPTLVDFDRAATRQEERAMRALLGHEATTKGDCAKESLRGSDPDDALVESFTAVAHAWRRFSNFRAPWETYEKPVSGAQFFSNQRALSSMPTAHIRAARKAGSSPCSTGDDGLSNMAAKTRSNRTKAIELRARGTNAYAALQRGGIERSIGPEASIDSDAGGTELDEDIPAQSVEFGNRAEGF
ncbi:hypothetical protein BKA63DRAFT_447194, partial [Paraphoma chrysanthemicola]